MQRTFCHHISPHSPLSRMKFSSFWVHLHKEQNKGPIKLYDALGPNCRQESEIVVIGGGIFGLSCAYRLQSQGHQVTLLEARRISAATTGNSTGKLVLDHNNGKYQKLIESFDVERARVYRKMNSEGLKFVKQCVEQHKMNCDFSVRDNFTYAFTDEEAEELRREVEACHKVGITSAKFLTESELPELQFPNHGAMRVKGDAQFNAYSFCVLLAEAFVKAGGEIYEKTRVVDVISKNAPHIVRAENGGEVVATKAVIVATHLPILDRSFHWASTTPSASYGIAFPLDKNAQNSFTGMYINSGAGMPTSGTKSFRTAGDGKYLVIVGAGHAMGESSSLDIEPYEHLEQFAKKYLSVHEDSRPVGKWFAFDYYTSDDIPYIGKMHGGSETLFTGTGFAKWGLAFAAGASSYILQLVNGQSDPHPYDMFDARRWDIKRSKMIRFATHVACHFVVDRLRDRFAEHKDVGELPPGQGGLYKYQNVTRACYRDEEGKLVVTDLTCPHLKCHVRYNQHSQSLCCPCHGSHYNMQGHVLDAPTVRPLPQILCDIEDIVPSASGIEADIEKRGKK